MLNSSAPPASIFPGGAAGAAAIRAAGAAVQGPRGASARPSGPRGGGAATGGRWRRAGMGAAGSGREEGGGG